MLHTEYPIVARLSASDSSSLSEIEFTASVAKEMAKEMSSFSRVVELTSYYYMCTIESTSGSGGCRWH
jgi:hypothetical protein